MEMPALVREAEQAKSRYSNEVQKVTVALEAENAKLRESERALERRAREDARRMLLEGRAEIERTVRELRETGAVATARDARRRVEELAATHAEEIERLDRIERVDRPARRVPAAATGGVMAVGDTVEMETLDGRTGQIVELRNDQAIVAVGALKMTVPVSTLSTVSRAAERAASRTTSHSRASSSRPSWYGSTPSVNSVGRFFGLRSTSRMRTACRRLRPFGSVRNSRTATWRSSGSK